jgi:hypothetical protein
VQYLKGIGFRADNDRVYPDLAFSLPVTVIPHQHTERRHRTVVGLGLMAYAGTYSNSRPSNAIYLAYLENLASVVRWLLAQENDVRLLIGDLADVRTTKEFRGLLRKRCRRSMRDILSMSRSFPLRTFCCRLQQLTL